MKATEEISDQEHPEFSDDAEEKAYYASLNKKPKEKAKNVPNKRQKTSKYNFSLNNNILIKS